MSAFQVSARPRVREKISGFLRVWTANSAGYPLCVGIQKLWIEQHPAPVKC